MERFQTLTSYIARYNKVTSSWVKISNSSAWLNDTIPYVTPDEVEDMRQRNSKKRKSAYCEIKC